MGENHQDKIYDIDQLNQKITDLEKRISRLEEAGNKVGFLDLATSISTTQQPGGHNPEQGAILRDNRDDSMESRIGEYGMAWLGNIVLLFGILYLTQLFQKNDHQTVSLIFGIVSVGFVYMIAHYTRNSLPYMSRLFNYNGHLLLYVQVMRITLFPGSQIITSPFLGHALIVLILVSLIYLAYRNNTQVLAILTWIMAFVTAIASGQTHFMLPLMTGIAIVAIFLVIRKGWWASLTFSIILAYLVFLIWILGNPFVGKSLEIIADHQLGYIYLFAIALAYSLLALIPKSEELPEHLLNGAILLNGVGFSITITLTVLAFFAETYFIYFGMVAAFCLGYSILLKKRAVWKNFASMYAIYCFVALSISIAGIYQFPLAYFLLSIESLLVISIALWYRSRFIVIMNTLLFIGLLATYLASAEIVDSINFSFALVALTTARVLNWKKKRLEIRTELIRNLYLFTGAVMVLYSLHEAVSSQFITMSWALSAVFFFVLSVIIHNKKYRWLAIITMVVTVFYLFIVDLKNISLGYRIVALMLMAAVSLAISIYYSRGQKERDKNQNPA